MAVEIFNATETEYTGTTSADLIIGNNLGNSIDAGEGNNLVLGGNGDDLLIAGSGNDTILGGGGNDLIDAGAGNNWIFGGTGNDVITTGNGNSSIDGGSGDDQIFAGEGNNVILGGAGNDYLSAGLGNNIISGGDGDDIIDANEGDDVLSGGNGVDLISGRGSSAGDETVVGDLFLVSSDDRLVGGEGNDTFRVTGEFAGLTTINGGTSDLDNTGEEARYVDVEEDEETGAITAFDTVTETLVTLTSRAQAEASETDVQLDIVTRPGSTAISTAATTIAAYNAVDTIEFTKSGDYSESLEFSGIERIELSNGVQIKLSSDQIIGNGDSLDRGFLNPGLQFYGVAGGAMEKVIVDVAYEDTTFTPASTIVGATETTYEKGDFQLDDFSVANLFHNVQAVYDAQTNSTTESYVRIDGANETDGAGEIVYGSLGVDNATMRLGDDTYYGNSGNDLLIGHGGADYLNGGTGDDIFVIGGFGSGVQGTSSKADDGNAEWIATGAKHDVIVGGAGVDTLRITTGIGAVDGNDTIVLNNSNFKSMEAVQVGATVGRLNVENADLQLINDHFYFKSNGTVADLSNTLGNNGGSINNVVVDASGLTTNGLVFEGNANTQTFIGTTKADVFVGNGGNDVLTGGAGADTFVFGQVHEQVVSGSATTVQTYVDTAFNLTGVDTITDFTHGSDHIELHLDQYALLAGLSASNLVNSASGAAVDANDYLLFNSTTHTLSYDADGSGAGAALNIAVLSGVSSVSVSDFLIA